MSDAQVEQPEKRQKRARNSVSGATGKVSWDDIELGSSEDEALPQPNKGKPAVSQSRRDRVRYTLALRRATVPSSRASLASMVSCS